MRTEWVAVLATNRSPEASSKAIPVGCSGAGNNTSDRKVSSPGAATSTASMAESVANTRPSAATARPTTAGRVVSGASTLSTTNPLSVLGEGTTGYTSDLCEGEEVITASLLGTPKQAEATISIAPLSTIAGRLEFVSSDPAVIVTRGSGNGSNWVEESTVTFLVTDVNGRPIPGADVSFELSTTRGGLALSNAQDVSDASGRVTTIVEAGNRATQFSVLASIDARGITSSSEQMAVSSGYAEQRGTSLILSGGGHVIENGFNQNGVERVFTVRLRDIFGSPIPAGTRASFEAEYGTIDPFCTVGLTNGARITGSTPGAGECSVLWTSSDPREPADPGIVKLVRGDDRYDCGRQDTGPCPLDLGEGRGGRATISVSANGEEWYRDANKNRQYDEGEEFENLPEAFNDDNEDGVYTPEIGPECDNPPSSSRDCTAAGENESFVDVNKNGGYDTDDDPALYNGSFCPSEGDGIFCSTAPVSVRAEAVLVLSDASTWDSVMVNNSSGTVVNGTRLGQTFTIYVSDIHNNPPPEGSKLTVTALGDCDLLTQPSVTVPDKTTPGAVGIEVRAGGIGTDGQVAIDLVPSDGSATYSDIYDCEVNEPPPPDPNAPG